MQIRRSCLAEPHEATLVTLAVDLTKNGTRGRRARAASQPGSQHVDLAAWRGRVEAVREHRCPRPERSVGNPAVARDQVGGKDAVRDEPLAFAVYDEGEL